MAVVATADRVSGEEARDALIAVGFPAEAINIMELPVESLAVGLGPKNSYFMLGARAGPFASPWEREEHLRDAEEPAFLVRGFGRPSHADPYGEVERRKRAGPTTEFDINPAMQRVLMGIQLWADDNDWDVLEQVPMRPQLRDGIYSNGTECATNLSTTGCFGDTDDAVYFDSPRLDALPEGGMDMVVGANSHLTGKAVYSSTAVYALPVGGGQGDVLAGAAISSMHYSGSATRFANRAHGVENLFAVQVTNCMCETNEAWCLNATMPDSPHELVYVTRAFLDKATDTGPDPTQMLPAVVLRLRRAACGRPTMPVFV